MTTPQTDPPRVRPDTAEERELALVVVSELVAAGTPAAPHVITKLLRRLGHDPISTREVAAELSSSQRGGQRMLPRELPLAPSIAVAFDTVDLDEDDRRVLLLAALRTDDDLASLVDASGRSVDDIQAGALGTHLRISHGRCRFADIRMITWLRSTAPGHVTHDAHRALEQAHRERGDQLKATWHAACGALERAPEVAAVLLSAAHGLNESGQADKAFLVAMEAADHALGAERDEALFVAGISALALGCFEEAGDWLGSLFPRDGDELRRRAFSGLLFSEAYMHGSVPTFDAEMRPSGDSPADWLQWARTAGLAAMLCAERGASQAMRTWLTELREADARADAGGTVRDPVVALCLVLGGASSDDEPRARGPFAGGVIGALHAAIEGDIEAALRRLSHARSAHVVESDPLVADFARSPLVDAHLAVTDALLRLWQGDIEGARDRLRAASVRLPVALPFNGLGAALARRLDIMVFGAPGAAAVALAASLPDGTRIDRLVDTALIEYLGGARVQAATDIALWHEQGAADTALTMPGLEEVGPVVERAGAEPPDQTRTRQLLARIRRLASPSWRHEHDEIAAAGAGLVSPFNRARVEAMLGSVCIIHGDVSAARRHLHAARSLFDETGALAWRDAVDERITRLGAQLTARSAPSTVPITVVHDVDPIEASRVAWSALLPDRALEVAMRVVEGRTNSEIATDLDVSVRTVEVHVSKVFSILGVRNRVELTVLAHRTGAHI